MKKNIKINMGCGWRNFGTDWVHIDGSEYEHVDSNDISNLHFKNNSVSLIYASHLIEYFDREEIEIILKEWYRVLKKGGILRIAVPDFNEMCKLYINNKVKLGQILGPLYGKMTMNNNNIYHKTTYDFYSLKELLTKCGFSQIMHYNWRDTDHCFHDDHSQAYLPHMDKENGVLISLNVEGVKL